MSCPKPEPRLSQPVPTFSAPVPKYGKLVTGAAIVWYTATPTASLTWARKPQQVTGVTCCAIS
jgi:hypothetical protein